MEIAAPLKEQDEQRRLSANMSEEEEDDDLDFSDLPPPPDDYDDDDDEEEEEDADDDDNEDNDGSEEKKEDETKVGAKLSKSIPFTAAKDARKNDVDSDPAETPFDEEGTPSPTHGKGAELAKEPTTPLSADPPGKEREVVDEEVELAKPRISDEEELHEEEEVELVEEPKKPASSFLSMFNLGRSKITVTTEDGPKEESSESESEEEAEKPEPADEQPPPPAEVAPAEPTVTRVAERLDQAVRDASKSSFKNRSPELVPLMKDYQLMRKKLRSLIAATKDYQKYTVKREEARCKFFEQFEVIAKDTPLEVHVVGQELDPGTIQDNIEKQNGMSLAITSEGMEIAPPSQLAHNLGTKSLKAFSAMQSVLAKLSQSEYQQNILDYAIEWEKVVTDKLDEEIREVKKLQQQRLHYESKVDGLRKKVNRIESKGKETPQEFIDKVNRNELKLKAAWEQHEQRSGELCVLLEEVTIHHWKDLYPLLKHCMHWEVDQVNRENRTSGQLPPLLEAMAITCQDTTEGR